MAFSVMEVETDVDFVNDPLKEVKDEETGEVNIEVDIEMDIEEDVNVVDGWGESVDTTPPMPFKTTPTDLLQQAGSSSQQ